MPIIRKIRATGDSSSITLPKSWLDWIERQTGERPKEVTIEVNGVLKVSPVLANSQGA
jgi:antitoxin component of MazEF toxin-antitoxin module